MKPNVSRMARRCSLRTGTALAPNCNTNCNALTAIRRAPHAINDDWKCYAVGVD